MALFLSSSFPSTLPAASSLQSRISVAVFPRCLHFSRKHCISLAARLPQISASSGVWKKIVDPSSGNPYYWNTDTNETTWERPIGWRIESESEGETAERETKLPLEELTSILLAAASADASRFGDVANRYRPQCFENEFFEHLTHIINTSKDKSQREEIEKLRARLANPLLKNPPPY